MGAFLLVPRVFPRAGRFLCMQAARPTSGPGLRTLVCSYFRVPGPLGDVFPQELCVWDRCITIRCLGVVEEG